MHKLVRRAKKHADNMSNKDWLEVDDKKAWLILGECVYVCMYACLVCVRVCVCVRGTCVWEQE